MFCRYYYTIFVIEQMGNISRLTFKYLTMENLKKAEELQTRVNNSLLTINNEINQELTAIAKQKANFNSFAVIFIAVSLFVVISGIF